MSSPRRESAGAGAGIGHSSAIVRDEDASYDGLAIVEARGDAEGLARFVAAWSGHARWADSYNLLQKLGLTMEAGR